MGNMLDIFLSRQSHWYLLCLAGTEIVILSLKERWRGGGGEIAKYMYLN